MKKVLIIVSIAWFGILLYTTYNMWLKNPIETRRYVNEIIQLEIDSCHVYKSDTHSRYELFIGGEYVLHIDSIKYIPFERKERVDFYVKDKYSEYVVTDCTNRSWQHDIDKLMEYSTDYLNE